jgi:SAM-dependent methyltransferase
MSKFESDAVRLGGYVYTSDRKSCRVSNARISSAVACCVDLRGKRVLDVGCGDGTYTKQLLERGASLVVGVDEVAEAISIAQRKYSELNDRLSFRVLDASRLSELSGTFDVAVLRGVIHHVPDPETVFHAVRGIARQAVVVEPNGFNPIVKLLERCSRYHIEHGERSYSPAMLRRWALGSQGELLRESFIGLVPFFCPDWAVSPLKFLEPFLERLPVLRLVCCGQYVFSYSVQRKMPIDDDCLLERRT